MSNHSTRYQLDMFGHARPLDGRASAPQASPPPQRRSFIHKLMEKCVSHEFRFVIKLILILYSVVLAHAGITGHPLPAADYFVMLGLGTVEVSLVSLILQVTLAKVDSQFQYNATIASIVLITLGVGLNTLAGVSVIKETLFPALATYTNFVTPMFPVVTLLMVFICDSSSDFVQRRIRQSMANAKIWNADQNAKLLISKSRNKAKLQRQTIQNQSEVEKVKSDSEAMNLELLRERAMREAEMAQLNAQIQIAQNEAEIMAMVAKRSANVRGDAMKMYVDSPEFKKSQSREAKKGVTDLLKRSKPQAETNRKISTFMNGFSQRHTNDLNGNGIPDDLEAFEMVYQSGGHDPKV